MKKKRIIILILQIVIVLGSIFAINNYTNNRLALEEVFVYRSTILDVDKQITANDIQKVKIPREAITKDFARNPEDIIGKHIDGKVYAGQYVYYNQLIDTEDIDIFETLDLTKYRKISLPISYEEAFAGNIKRGDTIDLMYVGQGQTKDDGGGNFNYSKVFMQNVLVYSVNTGDGYKFIDRSNRVDDDYYYDETIETEAESGDLAIVTLAVTLDEAEQIEARAKSGHIKFVGRFNDSKDYNTLGYVMGDYGKIFSGKGFAETDNLMIVEDDFDVIDLDALEEILKEELDENKNENQDETEKDKVKKKTD